MAKGDANFGAAGKKGYMGGKYSRKAMNLSKKELGKAGVAAARKRTVDISQTRRESGKTLGPGGKPLTGRVKMGNGNIAVYKDGKRVISQAPKKASVTKPRGGSSAGTGATKPPTPPAKKKDLVNTRKARDAAMAGRRGLTTNSRTRTPMSGTVSSAIAGSKPAGTKTSSGSVGLSSSNRLPSGSGSGDWVTQAAKAAFTASKNAKPQTSSSSGPKKGDFKQTMSGPAVYNGSRWVRAVKKNGRWVPA